MLSAGMMGTLIYGWYVKYHIRCSANVALLAI
jgi:hypothetical protein